MQDMGYLIGVLCAIGSGIFNNLGTVLQKKVVNELEEGEKIGRKLLKNPVWMLGLVLQMVVGSILFLLAFGAFIEEWAVGPGLVPGLMALGLVILAIGSMKILGEQLKRAEILGIGLMIVAIILLGVSQLEISTADTLIRLDDLGFIIRIIVSTVVLSIIAITCELFQRVNAKYRGLLYAISSGCMFAMSNFWVAPLTALIEIVFTGQYIAWFVIAAIILVLTNFIGIFKIQQAFQHGQAANLIPIQQVPIQVFPILIFFAVFMLVPLYAFSMPFMIVAVVLIIISSFLLAQRQAKLEKIK